MSWENNLLYNAFSDNSKQFLYLPEFKQEP